MTTDVPSSDRQVTAAEPVLSEPIVTPPSVLEAITRSELDASITTARRYPRSLAVFRSTALSMVRLDQATAAAMFYALPRRQRQEDGTWKRTTITGPSVRLAELVAAAWGHLRSGARIVAETDREVVAQGFAQDLQANNTIITETRRRIVDRNGRRYPDDLIILTANAVAAIARRNAVFAVIPRVFIEQLVETARKVAAGEQKTLTEGRSRALAAFAELGVSSARVFEKLERSGIEDIDLEDLGILHGLLTAIREGESSVAAEFPTAAPEGAAPSKTAELTEQLRRRRRPEAPAPPPPPAPSEPPPARDHESEPSG
jgi:hypothetical protein